jgi:hypothetical protein
MTFIRAFIRADRWREWYLSIPVYDGRNCPECGALCVGSGPRKDHQAWHTLRTEFDSQLLEAVRQLADHQGLNVVEPRGEDAPDGLYEDEDIDRRLTRKARAVVGGGGYGDEENDE